MRAVLRAYTGIVDINTTVNELLNGSGAVTLVRRCGGGGGGGGGGSAAAAAAFDAARFSKLLGLHADLVGLKEHRVTLKRAEAGKPYLPHTHTDRLALGAKRLFQLEQAAWKQGDDQEFTEESIFWRSAVIALFDEIGIGKEGDDWLPVPDVERAASALEQLERLLLSLALCGRSKKVAIENILAVRFAPCRCVNAATQFNSPPLPPPFHSQEPMEDMIRLMTPQPKQVDAAIAALDGPLYDAGTSKTYALRHLLVRLNTLWNDEVDHAHVLAPPPVIEDDLRYFKQWTVEHIYPKKPPDTGIEGDLAAHDFFLNAATKRLHWLGNLAPLHVSLNRRATNDIFQVKRDIFATGNNTLVRAAGRVDGYVRGATAADAKAFASEITFTPARFQQRHDLLKALVVKYVFGRDGGGGAAGGAAGGGGSVSAAARAATAPAAPASPPPAAAPAKTRKCKWEELPGGFAKRDRQAAYDWALANWVLPAHAGPLRAAIDALVDEARGPGYATAGNEQRLNLLHSLANKKGGEGFSRYVLLSRRVDIIWRFARGKIKLADFNAVGGNSGQKRGRGE